MAAAWDLTALVNAADPKAGLAERHLWLVRLFEWLRQPHPTRTGESEAQPLAAARLRLLLQMLDGQPEVRARVRALAGLFWREVDAAALFAEFGFGARQSLTSELLRRLRLKLLPGTPETANLAELFQLLFEPGDARWVATLEPALLDRLADLVGPGEGLAWRAILLDAMTILVSAVHAGGYAPSLRQRMDRERLAGEPFRQLTGTAEALRGALLDGRHEEALQHAHLLRALLDACRRAAASVTAHLEEFGVSVDIVFELDQLQSRTLRIEALLDCVLSPEPALEMQRLLLGLLQVAGEQRDLGPLLRQHYSLLARQVAERHAETGDHYITRDRAEYRSMLARAAGGGAVIAGTTFVKFAIYTLGLSAFWAGLAAGTNYAASFVLIMLLHWTVATKQPAMTAPAMAATLMGGASEDSEIETFVDRVAQLIRSQAAGIAGNLLVCGPLVLALQLGWQALTPHTLVDAKEAAHVLHALSLLGPTPWFAAFTGVLLFASSLIAGWAENWFVFRRLDSAIAWNPRFVAVLGAPRAKAWSRWWRLNVSGLAANVSLGLLLGLVPAVAGFFALPLDVRHVTLGTGQLAAASAVLGWPVLRMPEFWWCVGGIAATGVLNLAVSFALAFMVALRSRGVRVRERARIRAAIFSRLRRAPLSFVWPPRD